MMTTALSAAAASSNFATESLVERPAEEDEEPSMSSAALCISINILGLKFHPEFTHQYFDGEYIPGYQPTPQVLEEAKQQNLSNTKPSSSTEDNTPSLLHSSHRHHEEATYTLDASVVLAPSCQSCKLSLNIKEKSNKRPRIENEVTSDNDKKKTQDSDPVEPLSTDEIQNKLRKALPMDIQSEDDHVKTDYLDEVIGTELMTYKRKIRPSVQGKGETEEEEEEATFVLSIATGTEAFKYHNQVQKLALCFIENADNVDLTSSEGGGYWKVLYLFRQHNNNDYDDEATKKTKYQYSLVGYMTLFHFLSPFKKPKGGVVIRICQALVLPPYQRAGHGKVMFHAVHDIANKKYKIQDNVTTEGTASFEDDIVEINVEDPAPGFIALRDKIDYELLLQTCKEEDSAAWGLNDKFITMGSSTKNDMENDSFFVPLPDSNAVAAGAIAKITSRQVHIAYEIYKLHALYEYTLKENPSSTDKEALEKRYRLMVKKRLLKTYREDMGGLPTKEAKQAFLAKAFDEVYSHYSSLIGINN